MHIYQLWSVDVECVVMYNLFLEMSSLKLFKKLFASLLQFGHRGERFAFVIKQFKVFLDKKTEKKENYLSYYFIFIKNIFLNDISFPVGRTFSETSYPHMLPAEAINKITVICSYRYIRNNFIVINSYSVDWLVPWLTGKFFLLSNNSFLLYTW